MVKTLEEHMKWAIEAGGRLRLLQASCSDLEAEQRRRHIGAELDHLLAKVPRDRQRRYLNALMREFPLHENSSASHAAVMATQEAANVGDPFLAASEGPEELAERLISASSELSEERRMALVRRLAEAGLALESDSGFGQLRDLIEVDSRRTGDLALSIDVMKAKLDLPLDRPLDLLRVFRLLAVLLDVFERLDHMLWNIWRKIAPNSRLQPGRYAGHTGFSGRIAAFLSGHEAENPEQPGASIEPTVRLNVAVLNGLGLGGRKFARQHLSRIAPENIAKEARQEGGSFMQSLEHRSWQRYESVCQDMTPESLEAELQDAVARAAEELYHSG